MVNVGNKYLSYQDGKASRKYTVIIDDIVPRSELSRRAQRLWKKALKEDFKNVFDGCIYYNCEEPEQSCQKQFWNWNCNQFIVGHIVDDDTMKGVKILFAQRYNSHEWYGVDWNYSLETEKSCRQII